MHRHHRLRLFVISAAALALITLGVVVRQGGYAQDDYTTFWRSGRLFNASG
jgi:hypothetical protein